MVGALLIKSGLKPDRDFEPLDERITDDRFVVVLDAGEDEKSTREKIGSTLTGMKNFEIN